MFDGAISFDRPVWFNTENVIDIAYMFHGAQTFNAWSSQSLQSWNVAKIRYMEHAFESAYSFNQDLCSWADSLLTPLDARDHEGIFDKTNCPLVDDPWLHPDGIPSMCTTCGVDIEFKCFENGQELRTAVDEYVGGNKMYTQAAYDYGKSIEDWCVDDVEDFSWLFAFHQFNADLSRWNVSSATDMSYMFYGDENFDSHHLEHWDVSRVKDMVSSGRKLFSTR